MPHVFSNNASTTLSQALTDFGTTAYVTTGGGELFPAPTNDDFMYLTIEDSNGNFEIVKCTGRTGDTFTIQRAHEGTFGRAFSAGDRFELRLTAGTLAEFVQRESDGIDGGTF